MNYFVPSHINEWTKTDISEMQEKTIVSIDFDNWEGPLFTCADGSQFLFTHFQECCEEVDLEDTNAPESFWTALNENKGATIISAEERSENKADAYNSETWTFYNFQTDQGYLNLRFYGESNGYYSESVDIMKRIAQWKFIQ